MSRIAAPLGEVTIPILRGNRGNGPFPLRCEQAFDLEFSFERFESGLEHAEAERLQHLDTELVLSARFENRNIAVDLHLRSVGERLPNGYHGVPENYAGDLSTLIFEREILVSARMQFVIGNLALDPNGAESGFKRAANRTSQLGDGEDFRRASE